MMQLVVDAMARLVAAVPDPVLAQGRVGARMPSGTGDLPAIVVAVSVAHSKGTGIGRFIRAGDAPAAHTRVADVRAGENGWSPDLRALQLDPLPLRKNPATVSREFGPADVQVRNVTATPVAYGYEIVPSAREEFRVDPARARLVFGAPQRAGDRLEVTHWTMAWRDEVLGDRYTGTLSLQVCAAGSTAAADLSRRLQERLRPGPMPRQAGFARLAPIALDNLAETARQPALGSAFGFWAQTLTYGFTFEYEEGGELSTGARITRIDVDTGAELGERLTIPAESHHG